MGREEKKQPESKFTIAKALKWVVYIVVGLAVIVAALIFAVQTDAGQDFLKTRLVNYLQKKIETKVSIKRVKVAFPNSLIMEDLFLQGRDVDTLLFVHKFDVGLSIPQLLKNKADLTSIDLDGVKANVVRNKNGSFNYDYIKEAFATKEKEESPSKPFILSLDKIKLQNVGVTFIDNQARNDIAVSFKYFDTRVRTFNLDQNNYALGDIVMDGAKFKLKQDLIEEVAGEVEQKVDSLREKKPLKLALNGIKLTNFNVDYGDDNSKTFAKVLFKEFSTKVRGIDFEKNTYSIDNVLLAGANIDANLFLPSTPKKTAPKAEAVEDNRNDRGAPLQLVTNKLVLDDVKVKYNNTAEGRKGGLDPNHLNFSKLNLELRNFKMNKDYYAGTVNNAQIKEAAGLNILNFNTDFLYSEKQAYLKSLYLETPKTVLRDEVILDYNSIQQLSANPGSVRMYANLRNTKIAFTDIINLVPSLRSTAPFNTYPNAVVNLDTEVKGTMDDLRINRLRMTGLDKTVVVGSGHIMNATKPERMWFDLNIHELSSTAKAIYSLVPKGTIPSNISLPSAFTIRGKAKGVAKNLSADLTLNSTLGDAKIDAIADMRNNGAERYDVKADLRALQIGKIIQNKDLGIATGVVVAKGQGFDPAKGYADISGNIKRFDYKGYHYQNMVLKGKLNRGAYAVNLNSADPNANLKIVANGVYNEKNPTLNMSGDIRKLDLYALGFYSKPMTLAGDIKANFTNMNPDFLNGELTMNRFAMSDGKEVYPLQEIYLKAVSTNAGNSLVLNSQIADIELNGKYKLTQIGEALMQTVDEYYNTHRSRKRIDPHQYFTFTGKLKDDDLIRKFVPELKSFETIDLNGNFNADTRLLVVNGTIPQMTYGANTITNGLITLNSESGALVYNLTADEVKSEKLALMKINANGDIKNNTITYNISTKDEKDAVKFLIAGTAKSIGNMTELALNPDGLTLNYMPWEVAPGNKLTMAPGGIIADNFVLSKDGSRIALQSESHSVRSPLNVAIENFKIETITEIIKKDSLPAAGTINGTARIQNLGKNMSFTSDMKVSDLVMYSNPVGNIDIKVFNSTPTLIKTDIRLSGYDNDVAITGNYSVPNSSFDLVLDMRQLQMKSLQGFTQNAISRGEGYLSGKLDITGTTKSPSILGTLRFNDAGMEITKTGSNFRNINDEIHFTRRGIMLDNFKVKDEAENAMVINGGVLTTDYKNFIFDMTVKAEDFKVVDAKKDMDKLMYGVLAIDADLNIKGNMDLPKVDGKLSVTDITDFTFVLPQTSPTLQDRKGIVEFIDKDQLALNGTIEADTISAETDVKGLDVNVNIDIDKEAKISLIIDKANGDFVKLQGTARLTGGIDPSGKTTLVGTYEVEKGAYEMSLSLLSRKFEIQKGSMITWNGEPTDANLDITAVYRTEAAPLDLVQQQITGSAAEINQYKQRIPFNTLLKMTGELLKPVITFDITMDESNPGVATSVMDNTKAKLDQIRNEPSEMNKQVFALLALGRFVGENPFESQTGLSAEALARQSVSRLLSQTLNDLAGDLIAGVDMDFDLQSSEDYSSGNKNTRTDLNVALSKRFLNDRLKISVGSNFGLEGQARQNEQTTNIAGDIAIDYQLSKDGRYMLRAYRKNQYQVALQGQIIETGLGFIITLDYDKFRELIENQKKNKELRKNLREQRKNARKED